MDLDSAGVIVTKRANYYFHIISFIKIVSKLLVFAVVPRHFQNIFMFHGGLLVCNLLESDDNWMLLEDFISSSMIGWKHSITRGSNQTFLSDLIDKAHSEIDFTNGKHVIRWIWPAIFLLPFSFNKVSTKKELSPKKRVLNINIQRSRTVICIKVDGCE